MNLAAMARYFRFTTLALAGAGLFYLIVRFDIYRLPAAGCSPLLRFSPGQTLILDRMPRPPEVGDALLVSGDDGLLYMGLVSAVDGLDVWLETDAPHCPGRASKDFGWVEPGRVSSRLLMGLPW